ncbi:exopolysaccharide biosynthesis protein [Rhizobium sp. Root274]|uniref:exopolysaccharide biosynthesis protein n=1 Tax=unclassified Rhizobium TaxID=2613769 RepID=UPI0007136D39|nr:MULTISPECIES: exopolysaccharide biosynthesis protein [unclassified Rhizobium]KQW27179.1 exopolysaccharide biosynthesis protein [Rhizobium sp. Root1240]KRD26655.1 exopolysaccharide biosynthesis protein [Rhizobium sp. Root274]
MNESASPEPGEATQRLRRLSEHATAAGSVSFDELLSTMGRASIAFAILILALPALTPIPGPFGFVFGSCLALVSLQILAGYRRIWLPSFLGRRRVSAETIALILRYTAPLVTRIEAFLKRNRMRHLAGPRAQALLGVPVLLLAITVALPIPFGNFLPVGALVMIALGLIERDGLVIMMGLALAVIALIASAGLVFAAMQGVGWLITP